MSKGLWKRSSGVPFRGRSTCPRGHGRVQGGNRENISDPSTSSLQVYIIGHVPPGFFEKTQDKAWFRESFNEEYLKVVQKHHRVIAGQFFGHHHTDSFRMFYDDAGTHSVLREVAPCHFPLPRVPFSLLSFSPKVPP